MPTSETTPLNGGSKSKSGSDSKNDSARAAFEGADKEASRQYHDSKRKEEPHQKGGEMLKQIIFGGMDGILTSFAIVAGSAGGGVPPPVILVLGFSNIFADALSMGCGEFLSSKADNEWIMSERERENWEMENYPEGEISEMIEIFRERGGMSQEDAESVVTTLAKYQDWFVDLMMTQELELQVPDRNFVQQNMKEGALMFCSFAFFGSLPLLGYVIIPTINPDLSEKMLFLAACIITGIVLFFMGTIKSNFS